MISCIYNYLSNQQCLIESNLGKNSISICCQTCHFSRFGLKISNHSQFILIIMLGCFCLNILIETGTQDSIKVSSESLDDTQRCDSFFQQDILQIAKLINITKIHPTLVRTRYVGEWDIHCCTNCVCEAYAVHRIKGASCVFISSKLRDTKSIQTVRADDLNFSKVFNIIVYPNNVRPNSELLRLYTNCDVETILKNLKQAMTEFIKSESLAVEERINKYAEEQYEVLRNLKEKSYKDHETLVRFIQSLEEQSENESTKMGKSAKIIKLSDHTFDNINSLEMVCKGTKITTQRLKSSPAAPVTSVDDEALFDFEGSDGIYSCSGTDIDESDKEENTEGGIAMPQKQRTSSGNIAKSLPMDIPAFMSQVRNHSTEDLDDWPQEDNLDIAASIKALARSVHGDAVFGELPRPRFSTQI